MEQGDERGKNMNKNSGANSTHGATGPANDSEIHPAGTAERLRQFSIIGAHTAEILEEMAQDLKDSETINGEWPIEDQYNVHADYDDWTATAGYLRALCMPPEPPPVNEAPAFPPDEDITIYPWPTVDD